MKTNSWIKHKVHRREGRCTSTFESILFVEGVLLKLVRGGGSSLGLGSMAAKSGDSVWGDYWLDIFSSSWRTFVVVVEGQTFVLRTYLLITPCERALCFRLIVGFRLG